MSENAPRLDPKLSKLFWNLLQRHGDRVKSPRRVKKFFAWLVEHDGQAHPVTCKLIAHGNHVVRFTNRLTTPKKVLWPHKSEIYPRYLEVTLHEGELDDYTIAKVIDIFSGYESVSNWDLIQNQRGYGNYSRKAWLAGQGLPISLP